MGLLTVLFLLLFFLFPLGEILRIQLTNDIAFNAFDVGVSFVIASWVIKKMIHKERIIFSNTIVFFIVVTTFSLLANIAAYNHKEVFVAFLYLLRWILYASLFFVVSEFSAQIKKLTAWLMIVSGLLIVFIGYVQYFFYPGLRNLYYQGWDEHLYRLFGSFLDPNFAGAIIVLVFVLMVSKIVQLIRMKNFLLAMLLIISVFFTLGAVFLTYSRSAIIMLFVSSSTFIWFSFGKRYIVILMLFIVCIPFLLPKSFQTEGTNLLRTASGDARITSMQHAIAIFVDHPLLGVGFNAYRYAQIKYGFIENTSQFPNHAGAGVENSYLFVAATTGIFGLLFYVLIWKDIIQTQSTHTLYGVVVIASIAGLMVNALFINSLFYPFIMAWMWILLSLKEYT